jgi:hypothetical protein
MIEELNYYFLYFYSYKMVEVLYFMAIATLLIRKQKRRNINDSAVFLNFTIIFAVFFIAYPSQIKTYGVYAHLCSELDICDDTGVNLTRRVEVLGAWVSPSYYNNTSIGYDHYDNR